MQDSKNPPSMVTECNVMHVTVLDTGTTDVDFVIRGYGEMIPFNPFADLTHCYSIYITSEYTGDMPLVVKLYWQDARNLNALVAAFLLWLNVTLATPDDRARLN